jgi:uncharacterized OB-fold protein
MTTSTHVALQGGANRSFAPDRYLFGDGPDGEVVIVGSQSDETGSLFWPRRLRCPETGGSVTDVTLSTGGVLWSWTFVNVPWPGETAPNGPDGYGVGLVDLDGKGPRVLGMLLGNRREWHVGARMRACELHFTTIDGAPRSILAFEEVER